ncbi:LOW QUALITY PROTEIN: uncharacterized protein [Atheta coriaria]|uniref:LOW QUALITY PROTEIN: uncharacterized protein n=1 Tax=Dalotia coriaria TaxID=877792 RepID=UPI0031F38BD1
MDALPDELLLQILQYATPYDLKNIARLNERFAQLILERSLWTHIDCRGEKAHAEHAEYFSERVHEDTSAYMLRVANSNIGIPPERIRKWTHYDSLTVLVLEGMHFDCEEFTLGDFPKSLVELSLNRSTFRNYQQFFRFAGRMLRALRVITLEHCLTLGDSVVMPLANFEQLEIVSLYGCMSIKDALVPLTMSTKLGFRQLKVLDVRCTGLGNDLLRLVAELEQLGELYFHCYFDYIGTETDERLQCHRLDMSTNSGLLEACDRPVVAHYKAQFTDDGLRCYRRASFRPQGYTPPRSMLYARPYGPCACSSTTSTPAGASTSRNGIKRARSPSQDASAPPTKLPKTDSDTQSLSSSRTTVTFQPYFRFPTVKCARPPLRHRINQYRNVSSSRFNASRHKPPARILFSCHDGVNVDGFVQERQVALSALSLRGSKRVTDHGLESLRQLDLSLLDVTGTAVTQAGVAAFQARMPGCRVVHETACTCRPR